ncbi:MAG TPA: carbon monoxide dehydrogenase, partial [Actinomycetes bacterium]
AEAPAAGPPPAQAVPQPTAPRREAEPIDLLGAAGVPVLKRVVPLVVAVVALVLLWRFLRRRA